MGRTCEIGSDRTVGEMSSNNSSLVSSSDLLSSPLSTTIAILHQHLPPDTSDHLILSLLLSHYSDSPSHLLLRIPSSSPSTSAALLSQQLVWLISLLWGYHNMADIHKVQCGSKVSVKEFLRALFVNPEGVSTNAPPPFGPGPGSRRMTKRSLSVPLATSSLVAPASTFSTSQSQVSFTSRISLFPLDC